jgi:hypothetical protein
LNATADIDSIARQNRSMPISQYHGAPHPCAASLCVSLQPAARVALVGDRFPVKLIRKLPIPLL